MGWESSLTIDRLLVGIWRKYAPSEPSLLFRQTDLVIVQSEKDDESDGISWRTTARNALRNLHASGFTWDHLLSDYTQCRDFSIELAFSLGLLCGQLSPSDYARLVESLGDTSPEEDLRQLAAKVFEEASALHAAWSTDPDQPEPPTPIRDSLLFQEGTDSHRVNVGDNLLPEVRLILTRATDYFLRNQRSAPLVGWAWTLVLLLHFAPPESVVELDISGGLRESDLQTSNEYSTRYWETAQEDLASTARFYGTIFASLAAATSDIARAAHYGRLESMLVSASEDVPSNMTKGKRLEELVAALLELPDSGLTVVEKRLKHADEELDLVLRNDLDEAFWNSLSSPVVLVECKNWSTRVDIKELRILETKMRDRSKLCSVGIFVSLQGFTNQFLHRARDLQSQGLTIFPVEGEDIRDVIHNRWTLPEWLREKGLRRIL